MDPQQELFSAILVGLKALGYSVFDGAMPPDGTPYPFVYLADSHQVDRVNKSAVFGSVFQTIHVWHTATKRGTVSDMLLAIKSFCRTREYTPSFKWYLKNPDQRIMTDTSTSSPLQHGILSLEFEFSRR